MPMYRSVNKDFFKKWSPEMAYVLGFFAADGYITVNKRGGQFWCIQITDKDLLEKIREIIGSQHKISERISKKKNEKNLYRLQIGSIEMCNDLRALGFDERKTKSLAVPNVPRLCYPDFVRGYFDGDGHVWSGLIHKERRTQMLVINTGFTSCSRRFLKSLAERLLESGVGNYVLRESDGNSYRLSFSIDATLNLFHFMYNMRCIKSGLFLARKKIVFDRYIESRKNTRS